MILWVSSSKVKPLLIHRGPLIGVLVFFPINYPLILESMVTWLGNTNCLWPLLFILVQVVCRFSYQGDICWAQALMMVLHLMGFGNRGDMLVSVMSHVKRHVFSNPYVIERPGLNLLEILGLLHHLVSRVNLLTRGCVTCVGSKIDGVAYKYSSQSMIGFFFISTSSLLYFLLAS